MLKAIDIANYFIYKAKNSPEEVVHEYKNLSHLKLQKILYYAQGWHLGIFEKPLYDDKIYAWKFGPVTKSVYDKLTIYGRKNLAEVCNPPTEYGFDENTQGFLDEVWEQYGNERADRLVNRTHRSDPFILGLRDPFSDEISQTSMREYFAKLR